MPTKVGNAAQVSKAVTRELLASGTTARISSVLGKTVMPATSAYNKIQTDRLAEVGLI